MRAQRTILLARLFFILIATFCGTWIGVAYERSLEYTALAFISSIFLVLVEYSTDLVSSKGILMASIGLFAGLVMANLVYSVVPEGLMSQTQARLVCILIFGYLGAMMGIKHQERFSLSRLKFLVGSPTPVKRTIIVDTNVIIDGRVNDIYSSGFLKGDFLIPSFVLDELQYVADSTLHSKRTVGRRGLENLEALQEINPHLQIVEKDYPELRDVDQKLIQFAKEINGEILTNDFNLQKIASLHQVEVLNINELAQALKPPVYIGEKLHIKVIREGKDPAQGVGYLEDGTMVVVEDGRDLIGTEVDVVTTSILQTSAGRMVFARHQIEPSRHAQKS